jgi:hypothetical protein
MQLRLSKPVALAAATVAAAAVTLSASVPAFAASNNALTLQVDTVSTHGCLQTNVFTRGADQIVWRVNVLRNGAQDKAATVVVHVTHGPTIKLAYESHGTGPGTSFWAGAWTLPFNQPIGTVHYTVTANDAKSHLTGSYSPPFLVAPSELMVVPYTYNVQVTAGSGATQVAKGTVVPVKAQVTWASVSKGQTTLHPVSAGKVTAGIALEGNLNSKGQLIPAATVSLTYSTSAKAWIGSVPTANLTPGVYVIQVNAQDNVTPPNTGSGTSLAFMVQ